MLCLCSRAPAAQAAPIAPQGQSGLPRPGKQRGSGSQIRPDSAPVSPDRGVKLTRRASGGLPTIKESHVSLAALLSAPARLSPDRPAPQHRPQPLQQRGEVGQADGDGRRRRSEARLNAQLEAHPEVPTLNGGAARALWPDGPAASPEQREGRSDRAADEPAPSRSVPAAAVWAQPPAPLPRSQLPQGPFAFSAPGSVRRYSSPAASPPQWRPMRADAQQAVNGAAAASAAMPGLPKVEAAKPNSTPLEQMAAGAMAAAGGDGSDWEDAGRWLEPAAPGSHLDEAALAMLLVRAQPWHCCGQHLPGTSVFSVTSEAIPAVVP